MFDTFRDEYFKPENTAGYNWHKKVADRYNKTFKHKIKIKNKVFNCLPSFHPAFLLRQPEQKKQSWTDLQIIRDSLKEIEKS